MMEILNHVLAGVLILSVGFFLWVTATAGFSFKFSLFIGLFSCTVIAALVWNYTQIQSNMILVGLCIAVVAIATAVWMNLVQNSPSVTGKTPTEMSRDSF